MAKTPDKISLGFRQSKVSATTPIQSFGNNPVWHGFQVTMENGDQFGFYSENKMVVENFKVGLWVTYEYVKIIEYLAGDSTKIKYRIENWTLDLPRKERFESLLVPTIVRAREESIKLATTFAMSGYEFSQERFEEIADGIFLYWKTKLLEETFDFQESDSKGLVGASGESSNRPDQQEITDLMYKNIEGQGALNLNPAETKSPPKKTKKEK